MVNVPWMQRNYTTNTVITTVTGGVTSESTVSSDGVNVPYSFTLSYNWVISGSIVLNATRGGNRVVPGVDYYINEFGNTTYIVPTTVWDSKSASQNYVSYTYYRPYVCGNVIRDIYKDSDYLYVVTNRGFSMLTLSGMEPYAWWDTTNSNLLKSIFVTSNYIYIGTTEGLKYWVKPCSGQLPNPLVAFSTTTSPISIAHNTVYDIDGDSSNLILGTGGSCEVILSANPIDHTGTHFYNTNATSLVCWCGDEFYWVIYNNSLNHCCTIPSGSPFSATKSYTQSSTPSLSDLRINDFCVTLDTGINGGNTIFLGTNSGVIILTEDKSNYSNSSNRIIRSKNMANVMGFLDQTYSIRWYDGYSGGLRYSSSSNNYYYFHCMLPGLDKIVFSCIRDGYNPSLRIYDLSSGNYTSYSYSSSYGMGLFIAPMVGDYYGRYFWYASVYPSTSSYYMVGVIDLLSSNPIASTLSSQYYDGVYDIAPISETEAIVVTYSYVYRMTWNGSSLSVNRIVNSISATSNLVAVIPEYGGSFYITDKYQEFTAYRYNLSGALMGSIAWDSSNDITASCLDTEGYVWVGHESGKISKFWPGSGGGGNKILSLINIGAASIVTMCCVPDGNGGDFAIWCVDVDNYAYKLDRNCNLLLKIYLGIRPYNFKYAYALDLTGYNNLRVHSMYSVDIPKKGYISAFGGWTDNVKAIKAGSNTSTNFGALYITTGVNEAPYTSLGGAFTKLDLGNNDKIVDFIEFRDPAICSLEVL